MSVCFSSLDKKLCLASRQGRVDEIIFLLDQGAEINCKKKLVSSKLSKGFFCWGCFFFIVSFIGFLLYISLLSNAYDGSVSFDYFSAVVPPYLAVFVAGLACVTCTLIFACFNWSIEHSFSPLYWAAYGGHKDAVEILLREGAVANIRTPSFVKDDHIRSLLERCFQLNIDRRRDQEASTKPKMMDKLEGTIGTIDLTGVENEDIDPHKLVVLGRQYFDGNLVNKDKEKAARLYEQAADQGHPLAQFLLGTCYFEGTGVPTDPEKALFWFEKSARQGHAGAQEKLPEIQYALADAMKHGRYGLQCDVDRQFKLIQAAASCRLIRSQFALAECYQKGEGVSVDMLKAAKLYVISAHYGYNAPISRKRCRDITKHYLSPVERVELLRFEASKSLDQDSLTELYGDTDGYDKVGSAGTVGTEILANDDDNYGYVDPPKKPISRRSSSVKKKKKKTPRSQYLNPGELTRGSLLGTGSFGAVYKGRWRGLDVAVKEVKTINPVQRKALVDEAEGMKKLRAHKNIVTFYGICHEPELAIVVKLCEGGSLDDVLYGSKKRSLSPDQKKSLVLDVCRGILHLHCEKMVHRDLAARNVLLDSQGVGKVADFGMARGAGDDQGKNYTATTIGPIKWMAPEQMSKAQYSFASDMWSFAVLLFEIYNETAPWQGKSNMDVAREVIDGQHLPVPEQTPKPVGQAMIACFSYEPDNRPTAEHLLSKFDDANQEADWASVYDDQEHRDHSINLVACLQDHDQGLRKLLESVLLSADQVATFMHLLSEHDEIETAQDFVGLSKNMLQVEPYSLNARDAAALASLSEQLAKAQRKMRKKAKKNE